MRKILVLCLALLISVSIIGCSKGEDTVEFTGTITEIIGDFAIVSVDEEQDIRNSGDLVEVNLTVNDGIDFSIGDRVRVGYDGVVMEKYPLGINTIYIELLEDE